MKFKFNNLLYKHIRVKDCVLKFFASISIAFHDFIKIIFFTSSIINLGIEFDFRNYYFLTLFVALSAIVIVISICINLNYSIILINRAFLFK